jgi:hypothetical protein
MKRPHPFRATCSKTSRPLGLSYYIDFLSITFAAFFCWLGRSASAEDEATSRASGMKHLNLLTSSILNLQKK